jgi:hypothetical protein
MRRFQRIVRQCIPILKTLALCLTILDELRKWFK